MKLRSILDFKYAPALLAVIILGIVIAIQEKTNPITLDTIITENTDIGFEQWLFRIRDEFPTETIKEIRDARQEIRFEVMTIESGLPFKESQRRVYEKITGQSVRHLLIKGYEMKAIRTADIINLGNRNFLRINTRLGNERDPEHQAKLERDITTLAELIEVRREELKGYDTRIAELQAELTETTDSAIH